MTMHAMLSAMCDGDEEGLRWFTERCSSHGMDILDILRGLDQPDIPLILRLQASAVLAKIAREWADENEPSERQQEQAEREAADFRMPGKPITKGWPV